MNIGLTGGVAHRKECNTLGSKGGGQGSNNNTFKRLRRSIIKVLGITKGKPLSYLFQCCGVEPRAFLVHPGQILLMGYNITSSHIFGLFLDGHSYIVGKS